MDIPTMALIVQTCGVVGTLIAATIAVRSYVNSNKRTEEARTRELETRQLQIFMNLYQTVTSKTFQHDVEQMHHIWQWKDLDDFLEKYGAVNPEKQSMMASVFSTYDGMGVLVKRGIVSPDFVYDLIYLHALDTWERFRPVIQEIRDRYDAHYIVENWEYLYRVLGEVRERRGHVRVDLSGLDLSFQKKK